MIDMFHVDPNLEILGSITGNCACMSTVFILQQLILLIVHRLLHYYSCSGNYVDCNSASTFDAF